MSRIIIKESSADNTESSDNELERINTEVVNAARRLNLSSNKTDRRFLKVLKIRNAKSKAKKLPKDTHPLQSPVNHHNEGKLLDATSLPRGPRGVEESHNYP